MTDHIPDQIAAMAALEAKARLKDYQYSPPPRKGEPSESGRFGRRNGGKWCGLRGATKIAQPE
jgi:hypothetical protein